jgi:pimeloyl-ACP methyl ester carboxylesterase
MKLFARTFGNGPAVLILHGLFGMSDNWLTIGRALAEKGYSIHLPDLRNHGRSPHAESHRYPDMCDDLLAYLEEQELDTVRIIGHSMGGKLGMILALLHPERVRQLVVVDIAPADYRSPEKSYHTNLIDTLQRIDLFAHRERGAIREELEARLHDRRLAAFLTKSIDRAGRSAGVRWKFNLPVLKKYIQHLQIGLDELEIHAPCPVPTLFVKGNASDYYLPKHDHDRLMFFPNSEVAGIDKAGHWVHSEQPERFLEIVGQFFAENQLDCSSRQEE